MIRIPRGTSQLPLEINLEGENRSINGFAIWNLEGLQFSITPTWEGEAASASDGVIARSISLGSPSLRMDFETPNRVYNSANWYLNQRLTDRNIGDILFTPVSETEHALIMSPSNPTQYAYEGQIFYTQSFSSDGFQPQLQFRGAVKLESTSPNFAGTDDYANIQLSPTFPYFLVPWRFREEVRSRIGRIAGIRETSNWSDHTITLQVDDDALLSSLPSFDIVVQSVDGEQVQITRIDPLEYVIRSTQFENTFRIVFLDSVTLTLGRPVIKNLLLHIDYENRRIGFADPLVE